MTARHQGVQCTEWPCSHEKINNPSARYHCIIPSCKNFIDKCPKHRVPNKE